MLTQNVVETVRGLLADGLLSQRKIARRIGISRTTVSAIAQVKRPDCPSPVETYDLPEPVGPPRRCPTCGGMVFMPCLLCHIRAMKRR